MAQTLIKSLLKTRPTPKRLILSLLSAPTLETIEVGHLVQWGQLFGIEPSATRVAVGRLAKQGFITAVARGIYTIGPQGSLMAQTASHWAEVENRIGPWSGGWIVVHTSHLGRADKTALRARERAFRLNGFAELVSGLWCRPDNLAQALDLSRHELIAIGLEPAAVVMQATALPGVESEELYALWPRAELEAGYREYIAAMAASEKRLAKMSNDEAARETFLVGEAVIRRINADPLLPAQMVDIRARRRLIEQMVRYNELGRSVWEEFLLGSAG
jgi:phenylacetic acid degradation operon negative regulatory protein